MSATYETQHLIDTTSTETNVPRSSVQILRPYIQDFESTSPEDNDINDSVLAATPTVTVQGDRSEMGSVLSTMKQVGFLSLAIAHLYCVSRLAEPGSSLFSWHPFLSSAAFGVIMPEAFTQISRFSEFGRRFSYRNRVTIHWVLQLASLLLAGVGIACIVVNKNQNNRPHLTTFHSWFGASTFIYAALQSLGGLFLMYPKLKPSFAPTQARMKVYHAVSAASLMLCAAASMFFSNYSLWMAKHKMSETIYAAGMWAYPAILAGRSVYTVYESGAFGKLNSSVPIIEERDSTL